MFQNCPLLKLFNCFESEKPKHCCDFLRQRPKTGRVSKIRPGVPNQCLNGLVRNYKRRSFGESCRNTTQKSCDKRGEAPTNYSVQCDRIKDCPIHSKDNFIPPVCLPLPPKNDCNTCPQEPVIKKICQSTCNVKPHESCFDPPSPCEPEEPEQGCSEPQECQMQVDEECCDVEDLNYLHEEAENLYNGCLDNGDEDWSCLDSKKKIIYYWASIKHDVPYHCPWDNFQSYYQTKKMKKSCLPQDKSVQRTINVWKKMRYHEKLPFIAESLIGTITKFSNPVVDGKAECEIKSFFDLFRKDALRNGL